MSGYQWRHDEENSDSIWPPVLDYRCAGRFRKLLMSVKNDAALVSLQRYRGQIVVASEDLEKWSE
jgi:hypothetical protein